MLCQTRPCATTSDHHASLFARSALTILCLAISALFSFALTAKGQQQPTAQPTPQAQTGELITLRGKRLYVEVSGPQDAPALLYLHGGPGSGAYDFTLYQGQRLSRRLRLVRMDQRGSLRSDPLDEKEAFGLQDIIEDCEALRQHLGIKRWFVLGHSFGGYLAVRYALAYPNSVAGLLLESPSFDLAPSARSLLRGAALEYRAMGKPAEAAECLKAAAKADTPEEVWQDFTRLTNALDARRNNLYVHGPEKDFFDQLVAHSPMPKEWGRGGTMQSKLYAEKQVFVSLLPKLSELRCPALLIKGQYDWVTSADQLAAFRSDVRHGQIVIFQHSSHFPRVEEPTRYAAIVTRFVLQHCRKRRGTGPPSCTSGLPSRS